MVGALDSLAIVGTNANALAEAKIVCVGGAPDGGESRVSPQFALLDKFARVFVID